MWHPDAVLRTVLLASLLLIPEPGTTSRERRFCAAWLAASRAHQEAWLDAADARETEGDAEAAACRRRLRARLAHGLDYECRNRRQLSDLEVRAIIDRLVAPCLP